jgi:hypothetical protein
LPYDREHAVLFANATSLQHRDKISFLPLKLATKSVHPTSGLDPHGVKLRLNSIRSHYMKYWRSPIGIVSAALAAQTAFAADIAGPSRPLRHSRRRPHDAIPQPNSDVFGVSAGRTGVQFMSALYGGISPRTTVRGLAYGELREGWFYLGGDVLNVTLRRRPLGS